MRKIGEALKVLGKKDLYDYLEMTDGMDTHFLRVKAQAQGAQARLNNNKTAAVTASLELSGHCLSIFADEASRARYARALEDQVFLKLVPLIRRAMHDKEIQPAQVEVLLRMAREWGISVEKARRFILDHAKKQGWAVVVQGESPISRLLRCGACGRLNPETQDRCSYDGEPLRAKCPKCGRLNPSEDRACTGPNCGFSTGAFWTVRQLTAEARKVMVRGEVDRALRLAEEALLYWPGLAEAEAVRDEAQEVIDCREAIRKRLERVIADRRLIAARGLLRELRMMAPADPELARLEGRIEPGIEAALQHVARARSLERVGAPDDVVAACRHAQSLCRDLPEARECLEQHPPVPPADLKASSGPLAVSLNWSAPATRYPVEYRVVRKADSEPKTKDDGEVFGDFSGTTLTDPTAVAGVFYYYSVFTVRDQVASKSGATIGPVLRVAGVSNLCVTAGDRCVSLRWDPMPDAERFEVWRRVGDPPTTRGEGQQLNFVTGNTATDSGLNNGTNYGYCVIAVFDGPAGSPAFGPGVTCSVRVEEPAGPVTDLSCSLKGSYFHARWTPPPVGTVQVYVSSERAPPSSTWSCRSTVSTRSARSSRCSGRGSPGASGAINACSCSSRSRYPGRRRSSAARSG